MHGKKCLVNQHDTILVAGRTGLYPSTTLRKLRVRETDIGEITTNLYEGRKFFSGIVIACGFCV